MCLPAGEPHQTWVSLEMVPQALRAPFLKPSNISNVFTRTRDDGSLRWSVVLKLRQARAHGTSILRGGALDLGVRVTALSTGKTENLADVDPLVAWRHATEMDGSILVFLTRAVLTTKRGSAVRAPTLTATCCSFRTPKLNPQHSGPSSQKATAHQHGHGSLPATHDTRKRTHLPGRL